jgi:hypothetical protein
VVLEFLIVELFLHPNCLNFIHFSFDVCHHLDCIDPHIELEVILEWRMVNIVLNF